MFNFFHPDKAPLGLDLSDASLKIMQFKRAASGRFEIQAYTDHPIPKQLIVRDEIKNAEALAEEIRSGLSGPAFGRFDSARVAASVPETKSFIRVIQMPVMSDSEAREAVQWEAEQYIPMPMSQVYLDWLILDQKAAGAPGKMNVLITASPREHIDLLTQVLKTAGLQPVALVAESQATARSIVPEGEQEAMLILDLSSVRSSFIIFHRGALRYTASVPIAGQAFTEEIARALGVSSEEAERLKINVGLDESADEGGRVRGSLDPVMEKLVGEIQNTIRYYEEHSSEETKISRILLTGGSARLKGLPSYLHSRLIQKDSGTAHILRSLPGITVDLGNPWVNVLEAGQTPPLSRLESLSLATTIGLSLTGDEK